MSKIGIFLLIAGLSLSLAILSGARAASSRKTPDVPARGLIQGTVKSAERKPLEGVAVSARAQQQTFTTTVYTDRNGEYSFPRLESGRYQIWAQAVGFVGDRAELDLLGGKKAEQKLTLRTLQDFSRQLSGTEWMESLPDASPQDLRQREIFNHNCNSCHVSGFALQNRFDARGWQVIVDAMAGITGTAVISAEAAPNPLIHAYREEIVSYLTRVRGPDSPPLHYKPIPRPTGGATQMVVTEYDLPPGDRPGYILAHNGSDWSEGTPSYYEGRSSHDAVADKEGNVWFSDDRTPERSIGKLDSRTGRVTDYKLPDQKNLAVSTHGIAVDRNGDVWFTNQTEGILTKFHPKTEKFQKFLRPPGSPKTGGMVVMDSNGNAWVTQEKGAYRLNPKTGEYTEYDSPSENGGPYGITVDSNDNGWYAQINTNRLGFADSRTGKVSEVILSALDSPFYTDQDREIGVRLPALTTSAAPLDQKGPRRLGADRNGNTVWVGEYWAGRLVKIDIDTKKVTEYPVPHRYSLPYDVAVDKNHMVWINLMNSDQIAKFNPITEQFTEYPLPTRGTETRFIEVDNSTDPPTIWLPYSRAGKIARVQFRTAQAAQPASR